MNYNLLEQKWIPVLYRDGRPGRVNVLDALTHASRIREIALASPLDLFAVHRFMLTLLYWKAHSAGGVEQVRQELLKAKKVPSAVLDAITKEAHRFDLFDNKIAFLQDPSAQTAKEKKSAGSLFAELATGTNIAHFHHGDDENLRLCLPCVVLGMLRVVPWTQSGGRGLTPSIHNAPPIMALATGDNLAITLGLNLVPLGVGAGEAKWSGRFKPTDPAKPVPYLEALTWNPRRIYLPQAETGICWYCGQNDVPTVGPKIIYEKNDASKRKEKGAKKIPFIWNDPSAFYLEDQYEPAASTGDTRPIDNSDLEPLVSSESIAASKNHSHQAWLLVIPSTDKRNKTFDHRQLELDSLSPETIRALIPAGRPTCRPRGLDGWSVPEPSRRTGVRLFVEAAIRLLTHADWAALSNAAYREMHDSPAAFDVLAGLYWGLRDKKVGGLPSRNVAWLVLKLMASVPGRLRVLQRGAKFSPLYALPRRQVNGGQHKFRYPVSFPRGERLEAALRDQLDRNVRRQNPQPVDWIGLCHGLDQLLD